MPSALERACSAGAIAAAIATVAVFSCKRDEPEAPKAVGPLPGVGKAAPSASVAMTITTPAWLPGQKIPKEYTCDGDDRSPEVKWTGAPPTTKSFLLIVDDPDAPSGTFTHWVIFDVPYPSNHVEENATTEKGLGTQAKNDFGNASWNGPCPPKGKGEHRYFFKLFALDVEELGLEDGTSRGEVEKKIDGHVLAKIETMGTYAR